MPKIEYVSKNFSAGSRFLIDHANRIIEDYEEQGLALSLRQLYYRFVATDLIPNTQREYKRLGSVINDGRLAGEIDWDAIEDRGRNLIDRAHWGSPGDIIRSAAQGYAIDLWEGQEYRVEVWVEKQALEAVIDQASGAFEVDCFACRGYNSQSEMWRAAQRFLGYARNRQESVVVYLGDHDPSGIDMTRDIRDRLYTFGLNMMVVNRIALNMDQVEEYNPPPNPAKLSDSRAKGYIVEFGDDSWELDALEPSTMRTLIQDTIRHYLDEDLYQERVDQQLQERDELDRIASTLEEGSEI